MGKFQIIIFLLIISNNIQAQNFIDIINIGYGDGLVNSKYSQFNHINGGVKYPKEFKNKDVALFNLSANRYDIEKSKEGLSYQLRNVTFYIGFRKKIDDQQFITLTAITRWNGDKYSFSPRFFQFGGSIAYLIKKTTSLNYEFGVYANDELFGFFVTPFFGLNIVFTEKTQFFSRLPISFTLFHKPYERLAIGINYDGLISSFYQGATYVERAVLNMGPFADIYLFPEIVLRVHAGYLIGSSFNEYNMNDRVNWSLNLLKFGDNREQLSSVNVSGLFLSGSILYRYDLSKRQ